MNKSHWIKTGSNHVLLILMFYFDLNLLVTIWSIYLFIHHWALSPMACWHQNRLILIVQVHCLPDIYAHLLLFMTKSHWIKTSSNHVLLILMFYLDLNLLVTVWGSGPRWVDCVYQKFCSLDPSSRGNKSFICCPSLTYTGPRNFPTTLIPNKLDEEWVHSPGPTGTCMLIH